MKRTLFLLTGALVFGGCSLLQKPVATTDTKSADAPTTTNPSEQSFSGPFKTALALGVPMKCTYDLGEGQMGTGYLKGNKYRGEATVENKKVSMIVKDQCLWSWSEDSTQGVTFCAKNEEKSIWDDEQTSVPESDVNCIPTVVDDSMFEVDKRVNFVDLSQLQQMMQPPTQ